MQTSRVQVGFLVYLLQDLHKVVYFLKIKSAENIFQVSCDPSVVSTYTDQ